MTDINLDLLNGYRPSLVRTYIPRATFSCAASQQLHSRLRETFRALQSHRVPDKQRGPHYIELPTLKRWLLNHQHSIERLVAHDYRHRPDLPPCECCRAVLATGFHSDSINVAVELLEEIEVSVERATLVIEEVTAQ